jgi:hypothetical protein
MVTTVFSDEIINPTELKKNQRHWLDKALKQPVSVKFGDTGLAIVDRELMKNLYTEKHYAELLVKYSQELALAKDKSEVFPWLNSLDAEEKKEFRDEFFEVFSRAVQTNEWLELKEVFEDWEATAEAESNPEFMEAWRNRGNPKDYITLDAGKK